VGSPRIIGQYPQFLDALKASLKAVMTHERQAPIDMKAHHRQASNDENTDYDTTI